MSEMSLAGQATKYSSNNTSVVVTTGNTKLKKITVGIYNSGGFTGVYDEAHSSAAMVVSQTDFNAYRTRVDAGTSFSVTLTYLSDTKKIKRYVYAGVTIPSA
jgi:hypothetical protein